jgi:hypothetical protein
MKTDSFKLWRPILISQFAVPTCVFGHVCPNAHVNFRVRHTCCDILSNCDAKLHHRLQALTCIYALLFKILILTWRDRLYNVGYVVNCKL